MGPVEANPVAPPTPPPSGSLYMSAEKQAQRNDPEIDERVTRRSDATVTAPSPLSGSARGGVTSGEHNSTTYDGAKAAAGSRAAL